MSFYVALTISLILATGGCEQPAQREPARVPTAIEPADNSSSPEATAKEDKPHVIETERSSGELGGTALRRSALVESVLKSCLEQDAAQRARLAELEQIVTAVREKREAAAATRAADESWVREHCIWENDPRYALEARRTASRGGRSVHYDVNERFVGYSSSAPICPRETSKAQLAVAADIANRLLSNGRLVIQNSGLDPGEVAALAEHKDLSNKLQLCEDVASGKENLEGPSFR